MGQGSGLSRFLSSRREAPATEGFYLVQLLPIRPCSGSNDRSLSSTHPYPTPIKCSDIGLNGPASWEGAHTALGTENGPETASEKSGRGSSTGKGHSHGHRDGALTA